MSDCQEFESPGALKDGAVSTANGNSETQNCTAAELQRPQKGGLGDGRLRWNVFVDEEHCRLTRVLVDNRSLIAIFLCQDVPQFCGSLVLRRFGSAMMLL